MKILKSIICLAALSLMACSEDNLNKPYGLNDGMEPGLVEIVDYEAIPGGVVMQVQNPSDEDLLYVKARYQLDSGEEKEERISAYSNIIKIQGFGNTNEKTIVLSAVDHMENEGEPTTVKVIPGEPTYIKAYATLNMYVAFGGLGVTVDNEDEGNLIIDVATKDDNGDWYTAHTEYSSAQNIAFAVRGFDSEEREFSVTIRDPWGNKTETSYTSVTPWFESELDKSKFREIRLPNDAYMGEWGWSMAHIWNGNNVYGANDMCHSEARSGWPQSFTFNLGVTVKLSRYKYWQRMQDDYLYRHGNLKRWELYGRVDTPPGDGSWDGWTKILECESIKPSGLPVGQFSAADKEYAAAGEEFEFPLDAIPVRYIRWKGLETWSGGQFMHLQEVTFYGQEIVE